MHITIYKINNKDLLYSTGNYIKYTVINCNGKRIYIYGKRIYVMEKE